MRGRRDSSQCGIGQEAHIHDDVGVDGQAVLVAEALDCDLEALRVAVVVERAKQLGLQLVDVQVAGVDDQIGRSLHRFEALTLDFDGLHEPVSLVVQWVLAAGGVVALDEHRGGRVEVEQAHPVPVGAQSGHLRQQLEVLASGHQGELVDATARTAHQLDDGVHQRHGQVVDHVPAEVLHHSRGTGPSGS